MEPSLRRSGGEEDRGPAERARSPRWERWATGWPAAAVLLLLFAWMAGSSIAEKSATFDETCHIAAGCVQRQSGDASLFPEAGSLAQRLAVLPLEQSELRIPEIDRSAWQKSDVWLFGRRFLFEEGNDAAQILRSGRRVIIALAAGLGLLVWAWSRRLFGPAGGMLSLALYCFSPSVLAHGRLVTADLAAALWFTGALWCTWSLLRAPRAPTVIACGLAVGALLLSKMSGLLILPMAALLIAVQAFAARPLRLSRRRKLAGPAARALALSGAFAISLGIAWLVVWAAFGFRFAAVPAQAAGGPDPLGWAALLQQAGWVGAPIDLARRARLLPEAWLFGLLHTLAHSSSRPAFLHGEFGTTGWWTFFPICLMIKTPLATLGILVAALAAAAAAAARWRERAGSLRRWIAERGRPLAPLLALQLVYWSAAVQGNLNIGHRHLLPALPALFILAGGAASWLRSRRWILRALVPALLVGLVVESVSVRPHYLAFFNAAVGGPANGHRWLVDSSLDWGQDLPGLARWLEREEAERVYLSYFGSADPGWYGIASRPLPSFLRPSDTRLQVLRAGTYCVSATMLQGVYSPFPGRWNESFEARWQRIAPLAGRYLRTASDPAARRALVAERGEAFWLETLEAFVWLRFGRLCAFLRQRPADHSVGHSILVWRLGEADLRRALEGPPAELEPAGSGP